MPSFDEADVGFMRQAMALAVKGRGAVEPNPMVGCVIVKDGRAIGQGYHERFGGPHAEPHALDACVASAAGATAYVTLEPCCHTDKKTPPCVPQLIGAGLGRVVIGATDPNPQVAGRGAAQLRAAGIQADVMNFGPARQLIAPFAARMTLGRPYITLKWAESADGKVAGPGGRRIQISGPPATRVVHALRARSDAVLVGINTVLNDDPMLTARLALPMRPLTRIVLDAHLRMPLHSRLVRTASEAAVLVYTARPATVSAQAKRADLEAAGVQVRPVDSESDGRLSLIDVMRDLGRLPITHLLIEPGPTLAAALLANELWDRAWIIRSPASVDDATAPAAVRVDGIPVGGRPLGVDQLTETLNPRSGAYFYAETSADFLLAD